MEMHIYVLFYSYIYKCACLCICISVLTSVFEFVTEIWFIVLFSNLDRMSCSSRQKTWPFTVCLPWVWMCLFFNSMWKTRLIIIILCQMMSAILVELVMVEGFVTIPFSMSQEISDPYLCRHRIYYIKLH